MHLVCSAEEVMKKESDIRQICGKWLQKCCKLYLHVFVETLNCGNQSALQI